MYSGVESLIEINKSITRKKALLGILLLESIGKYKKHVTRNKESGVENEFKNK